LQPDHCLPRPRWDRLTLNVLLSFAQFEREVTAERIRDKIGRGKPARGASRPVLPRKP